MKFTVIKMLLDNAFFSTVTRSQAAMKTHHVLSVAWQKTKGCDTRSCVSTHAVTPWNRAHSPYSSQSSDFCDLILAECLYHKTSWDDVHLNILRRSCNGNVHSYIVVCKNNIIENLYICVAFASFKKTLNSFVFTFSTSASQSFNNLALHACLYLFFVSTPNRTVF